MKLRYLRVGNYPPLKDAQVAFSSHSPLARDCAIRFVVGLNGSGKSHLLQAVCEVFLALSNGMPPHFPVTLVFEKGADKKQTVMVTAQRSETQAQPALWMSDEFLFDKDADEQQFEQFIDALYQQAETQPHGFNKGIKPGSWSGGDSLGAYLPKTVLAYTTGAQGPWQRLWLRNSDTSGIDAVIENDDAEQDMERPVGWTVAQERQVFGDASSTDDAEQYSAETGWQPIFITAALLKLALLAVALPASVDKLKGQSNTHAGLQALLEKKAGLSHLVSVALELQFTPKAWASSKRTEDHLSRLLPWFEACTEVTGEPHPGKHRLLHFDLQAVVDAQTQSNTDSSRWHGEELLRLLGGEESSDYQRFQYLYDMHRKGLIDDLRISLRKNDTEDVISYDELSDGEQMVLGRMALFYLLRDQHDALLLLDEPETHFNDKWKREIVDIIDNAIGETHNDVLISTHSAIVLSDVFNEEIVHVFRGGGAAHSSIGAIADKTFAADPSALMIRVFDADDSIGQRAQKYIHSVLGRADWTQADIDKLKELVERMGSGFYRSELRTLINKWESSQGSLNA